MARRGRARSPETGRAAAPEAPDLNARGGNWRPLSADQVDRIAGAAVDILTGIGMSDAPPVVAAAICGAGGSLIDGRLRYPPDLVRAAIAEGPRNVLLAGQEPAHDMQVGGTNVHMGTGGAAPHVVEPDTGHFRPSVLGDLHTAARLADALPHVRFFSRSLVARDVTDPEQFDLATAAASLCGTTKHVMVQASEPGHVTRIARLCHEIAGGAAAFRARPFLSLNINHAVPPLRFDPVAAEVMAAAVAEGIPVHCNVFGQLGASSPVTLAGSVAQTLAETLAALAFVHALDPGAPRIAGPRPMITDLRTGGMAGGAGEQALATGIAVQVLRGWDLPCSVIAGATDSKLPDFQAGYEKALTITTAMQAGANLITQAVGMQAGLMGVSFAAMVADNDMIGAILRSASPPEVDVETLAIDAIADVVRGEGHFLGHPETYARMRSDFLYPDVADRRSPEEWMADADRADMGTRAAQRAESLIANHWPVHPAREVVANIARTHGVPLHQEATK